MPPAASAVEARSDGVVARQRPVAASASYTTSASGAAVPLVRGSPAPWMWGARREFSEVAPRPPHPPPSPHKLPLAFGS